MEWLIFGVIIYVIFKAINSNNIQQENSKEHEEDKARQKAAEDYILASGDEEAIKQLMLIRANPSNYQRQLATAANSGNQTMRTAFAVMGGFIAADLITTSMHAAALEEALASVGTELDQSLANLDVDFEGVEGLDGLDGADVPEIDGEGAEEGLSDIFDNLFS